LLEKPTLKRVGLKQRRFGSRCKQSRSNSFFGLSSRPRTKVFIYTFSSLLPSNLKEGSKSLGCRKGISFMLGDENFFTGTASCSEAFLCKQSSRWLIAYVLSRRFFAVLVVLLAGLLLLLGKLGDISHNQCT